MSDEPTATTSKPTTPKQHIIAKAASAASGKPPCDLDAPCQPCHRTDLQFLAVIPSVISKEHEWVLKEAGYAWAPSFDADFGNIARKATVPIARLAREGYVFIYYVQRGVWDVWQVMKNGLTRKVMHQVGPEQYAKRQAAFRSAPAPKLCSRGAANIPAHLISIPGAKAIDAVWLAYSPRLWSVAVLKRYAANPLVDALGPNGKPAGKVKLRSLRGREFNPAAVMNGQLPAAAWLPLNQAALEHSVLDYCAGPSGHWPSLAFGRAVETALQPLDPLRIGQAQEFAHTVRNLERALAPAATPNLYLDKTFVLMLPDPEGVALQHNRIRLSTLSAHQGWMAGGPDATGSNTDPKRTWERQSLLHAGYIREQVKAQEKLFHQTLLDRGAYRPQQLITVFDYQQIQAEERRTGVPVNPPGTTYKEVPGNPVHYRVTFPQSVVKQGIDDLAAAGAKGRIERYNGHIDWGQVELANQKWRQQEEGWHRLMQARDSDYVRWLETPVLQATLGYDFDDAAALSQTQREAEEIRAHAHEAFERINAMAGCYGGGACSDESLRYFVEMFGKDESDKTNYVAQAMMGEFSLTGKALDKALNDPGTQADLYDAVLGTKSAWNDFREAWAPVREQAAAASGTLLLTAYQVTQRMQELALLPALAQKRGLQVALADAARKQVIWARAAGFARFLETGQRQYVLGVKWKAGSFAEAMTEQSLDGPALDVDKRAMTGKQARMAARATRAELKPLLAKNTAEIDTTVMLVIDEKKLAQIAQARGEKMLDVVSPGLFGVPQKTLKVPESLAREIVRDYMPANKLRAMMDVKTGLNAAGLCLQWWALQQSWEDLQKKGGADQADAAFSALGALAGVFGAISQIGAVLLAPVEKATQGTPMAAVLETLPWYLRLQFAAGMLLAVGAGFDAAVAFVRARNKGAQGDQDAAAAYRGVGALQSVGMISFAVGAFYAHRAKIAAVYGQEAVVRVLTRGFTLGQLGRCLTGLGMVLWLSGLGLSFYALYLEDDDNEIFLRRSYFGKGHPQWGKFTDLDQETAFLAALAVGTRAELEWHDQWGPDAVTARLKAFKPEPGNVFNVVIEGFDALNGKKLVDIFSGEWPALTLSSDTLEAANEIHTSERKFTLPDSVQAVRLSYAVYKSKQHIRGWRPEAQGEVWVED